MSNGAAAAAAAAASAAAAAMATGFGGSAASGGDDDFAPKIDIELTRSRGRKIRRGSGGSGGSGARVDESDETPTMLNYSNIRVVVALDKITEGGSSAPDSTGERYSTGGCGGAGGGAVEGSQLSLVRMDETKL